MEPSLAQANKGYAGWLSIESYFGHVPEFCDGVLNT